MRQVTTSKFISFAATVFLAMAVSVHGQSEGIYTLSQSGVAAKISSTGEVSTLASGLGQGRSIAIDPQGTVYALIVYADHPILKIVDNGTISPLPIDTPGDTLISDHLGNLFIHNQKPIYRLDKDGKVLAEIPGLGGTCALASDAQGDIYCASRSNGEILKIAISPATGKADTSHILAPNDPNAGRLIRLWDSLQSGTASADFYPISIACGPDGNLYIVASNKSNVIGGPIYKVTQKGLVSKFTNNGMGVVSLTFDTQGNLFATDGGSIYLVTPKGEFKKFAEGLPNGSFWIAISPKFHIPPGNEFSKTPAPEGLGSTNLALIIVAVFVLMLGMGAWFRFRRRSKNPSF